MQHVLAVDEQDANQKKMKIELQKEKNKEIQ